MPEAAFHLFSNAALITGMVLIMLLLIEYVNVATHMLSFAKLQRSALGQVVLGALLGAVPGCIGGFATVAMFTHGVVNFGALLAAMIAAMGDEAFVAYAKFPLRAVAMQAMLFALAVAVGMAANIWLKHFPAPFAHNHLHFHPDDAQHHHHKNSLTSWRRNLANISFQRALLVAGLLFFMVAMLSGVFEHEPLQARAPMLGERWLNLLFLVVALLALVVIVRVDEHFLDKHLWEHVIKKHFAKIFLWSLGAMAAIALLDGYIEAQTWVRANPAYMLAAALVIGLIPASGPHLVFVFLFAEGSIPFGVLLANMLVQDGHAGIPLLAESKRGFLLVKVIKVAVGAGVGAALI
jgi:hypothetical protein